MLFRSGSEYHQRRDELKKNVFTPLIEYFRQARDALGITAKEIDQATGKQMSSHCSGTVSGSYRMKQITGNYRHFFSGQLQSVSEITRYTVNIMIWSVSNIHSGVNITNWQIGIRCYVVTLRYQLMCLIPMCGHSRRFSITPESTPVKNQPQ